MRRRKATVELFEEIRREYEFGIGTIQGVARKFGVHRRLVREALNDARPGPKAPSPSSTAGSRWSGSSTRSWRPTAGAAEAAAHGAADLRAARAERPGHPIAESTVRQYVRERKAAAGAGRARTFVPQSYPWGSEAQVDWYEAVADLDDERVKLQVFSMRSMAGARSIGPTAATQQAFLEAHELAFPYFGGVFRRLGTTTWERR